MVAPVLGPVLGGWLTDNLRLASGLLHQRADWLDGAAALHGTFAPRGR